MPTFYRPGLLFVCLLLLSGVRSPLEAQQPAIDRIMTHLLPAVAIEGQPVASYTLADRMKHYQVPGVSIAFFDENGVRWTYCRGVRDVTSGEEVDAQTVFQAASISKPVAGAGALTLVEDGLVDLDRDINTLLNSWRLPANNYTREQPVTLRLLLTHSAGLTVHGFPGYGQHEQV
ncbi:MAG: serine hydrolase domain-containing protein, partial [Saprospiraceae bacterium]|nr:serine hydrolase domain-containing protein [Saprospiraceae bacterium]